MPGAWNAGPEPADPLTSLWPRVVAFSREHAIFVGLVAVYFAVTAFYFLALGRWEHWTIQAAYPLWALAAIVFSCARLLVARLNDGKGNPLWRPLLRLHSVACRAGLANVTTATGAPQS